MTAYFCPVCGAEEEHDLRIVREEKPGPLIAVLLNGNEVRATEVTTVLRCRPMLPPAPAPASS